MARLLADAARRQGEPGIMGNITLPYPILMGLSLMIFGNFIYQPDDVRMLVRMAETGSLSYEWVDIMAKFPLEN